MRLNTLITTIWKRNNGHLLELQQSYILLSTEKEIQTKNTSWLYGHSLGHGT